MGGAGADPPSSKKRTFFLLHLALSVPIINKIYHRTKAGERLKLKAVSKLCEPAPLTTTTSPQSQMSQILKKLSQNVSICLKMTQKARKNKVISDGRTNGLTDGPTDRHSDI